MPDADPARAHDVGACGDSWEVELLGAKTRPASCELACKEVRTTERTCHVTPEEAGEGNVASNVFNFGGLWGACDSWNDGRGIRFQLCVDTPTGGE